MPRPNRADEAGGLYHALNRGNARAEIFRKPEDYDAFERILAVGAQALSLPDSGLPVDVESLALCPPANGGWWDEQFSSLGFRGERCQGVPG